MTLGRRLASVLAVAALASAAATAAAGTGAAAGLAPAKASKLVAFRSCADLLGYAKTHAASLVGAYGLGTPGVVGVAGKGAVPAAASAAGAATAADQPVEGVDYSGTNVQEQGVDEPDIVKTDGKTLFAIANGMLQAVDVTTHQPKLLGTLKLQNGTSSELLLHGTHLLILSRGGYWLEPLPAVAAQPIFPTLSQSTLTDVDVSDPSAMHVRQTLTLDGQYVTARMVGGVVRVVSSTQVPEELPFLQPTAPTTGARAAARTKNTAVVQTSRIGSWLPHYTLKKLGRRASTSGHALVQCRDVSRPAAFSGLGMLTVSTIDLDQGLDPIDTVGVMTDGRIVYASPTSLYVATEAWANRPTPSAPETPQSGVTTTIHMFDISDPTKTTYVGSGTVSGYLLDQWSLSEFQGVLRVVSTDSPAWWGPGADSQSYLTTLRPQNGALVQVGRVGGLGQGERVYAVRFVGNDGYVVTFRQVDPLYTLDLSDPANPQVMGELTITGYSAYLHPIGDNLLLGIGSDVGTNNEPTGTQISLFDVSDLAHPALLQQASLGQGWSEATSDHHAFLFWPKTALAVLPFNQTAVGLKVSRTTGIQQLGTITHQLAEYTPTIRRSVVVGDSLLTVSDGGVESSSLSTLANQGWLQFDTATPVPVTAGGAVGGGPRK
jgi:uncharacterized secreted protein with C-terminal beta-propeller domain